MGFVAGLGERGQEIWDSLKSNDPVRNALALELARTADRLDELDNIIQGKGVLELMQFRVEELKLNDEVETVVINVKFQSVLSEARQQQVAMTQIVQKLAAGGDDVKRSSGSLPENVTPLALLQEKMSKRA